METKQSRWLGENSPYRYHKTRKAAFSVEDCCGVQPQPDGSEILHYHPEMGELHWFPLCQCARCGKYWIALHGKWKQIENPLQFERRTALSR